MNTYYITREAGLGGYGAETLDALIDRLAMANDTPRIVRFATVRSKDVGIARLSSATLRYSAAVVFLNSSEWSAVAFVAGRYPWGEGLVRSDDGYVVLNRRDARDWCATVRKDMQGGHSAFPCAADSLARKLGALYDLCMGDSSDDVTPPRKANGKSAPRQELTADDVEFKVIVEPETVEVDGNASAIDPETDRATADRIYAELAQGNVHAWCNVRVVARPLNPALDGEGSDVLGCVSVDSRSDLDAVIESHAMRDNALADLNRSLGIEGSGRRIVVTFTRYTPESIEHGDSSDAGWIDDKGTRFAADDEGTAVDHAVRFLRYHGASEPSASPVWHPGVWYSTGADTINYGTGESEERSYHLKGFARDEEREIYERVTKRTRA